MYVLMKTPCIGQFGKYSFGMVYEWSSMIDWLIGYCLMSREQHFSYIKKWGKEWANRVNNFWMLKHLLFFEIYKSGFCMQGAWHIPNMLPTMFQGHAFHNITWQLPLKGLVLYAKWRHTEQLCVLKSPGNFHQYQMDGHQKRFLILF